ncbi:hypothetical protein J1N35_041821 [Gossypium stocksii]|uniref:Amino acid permease/ SLC12A domain-containing protein n=1 Tax=Gossypium stocksii TaxID=47602 RepID=A0A9D3ZJR7_9ROSI|nr:hypothetical protein J1N35_041821 [Gossypium stocksii]
MLMMMRLRNVCCRAIANFSVTFSIISVITGLTTMYSNGLTFGGPVTMVYGWPIVGVLTMIVGLAMAEICSAYPTSGGLYFWSARLCGNEWGPMVSWFTGWVPSRLRHRQDILIASASNLHKTLLAFNMTRTIS